MARELARFGDGQKDALVKALLQFLERPDAAGRLMTAIGGFIFEDYLKENAEEMHLPIEDATARRLPYDLVINGHRVQAKSSASSTGIVDVRPVRPVVGSMCRRYSQDDFDVLAVHLAAYGEVFFVPVADFACDIHTGMVRGSFVRELHTRWRDRWDVLSSTRGPVVQQARLFA